MTTLMEHFERSALIALEKQDKLELLLGEHMYEMDLDAGKIRFNDNLEFPFQVLGTESDNTLVWLWAWAEEQTEEIPEELLQASRQLRDWGMREDLKEFSSPSLDLGKIDGHILSMIAVEVCGTSCYFRDVYEGGSAFILLSDKRIDHQPSFDLSRLSRRIMDLVSRYDLNHRNVLNAYLRTKGLSPAERGSVVSCELDSGESLYAEFDENNRLVLLNGEPIKKG